jgi:hypothetical protein
LPAFEARRADAFGAAGVAFVAVASPVAFWVAFDAFDAAALAVPWLAAFFRAAVFFRAAAFFWAAAFFAGAFLAPRGAFFEEPEGGVASGGVTRAS